MTMTWFFTGVVLFVAALGALYWRWAKRTEAEIAEGAEIEWARIQADDPALLDGIDRETFNAIHRKVTFPRFPGYALAAVASFLLSLPITFAGLVGGLLIAERLGWTPQTADVANRYLVEGDRMRVISAAPSEAAQYYVEDLAGFYYFFGVIFVWLIIVAFFTRRYHARRPGYLRDEILRAR